jgi:hypothetical protein
VRWYGLGVIGQYSFYNYRLKDASETVLGMSLNPSKEVFRSNNLGLGVYNRIYIVPGKRPRPNSNGIYIDAGIRGDWSYGRFYKTKTEDGDFFQKAKYRNSYAFHPFSASLFAGIGFKWFVITANYRITDVLNDKSVAMDMPPLSVGMQFAFNY